ncbi:MAG: type VI secretion system contractile sheath small subunit [bacterium]
MAKLPTPKIGTRVSVKILPSSDAKESVELDYRLLIAGDFSKQEPGAQGELKDRRIWEIKSKRDFKTTLENINPQLKLAVPNRLSDDPEAQLEVNLSIKDMKDFHPDEISRKVEPLQDLMEARDRLKKLKLAVLKDPSLRKAIEGVLQGGAGNLEELMSKLEPAEQKG